MYDLDKKIKKAYESITSNLELRDKTFNAIKAQINCQEPNVSKEKKSFKRNGFRRNIAVAATVFLILTATSIGGYRYYFNETAYISIDVNPSIELSVNALDRVIKAESFNDDGARILSDTNVLYKNYNDAVEALVQEEYSAKYLSQDEYLLVTLQSSNQEKEPIMLQNIETTVNHCKQSANSSIQTEVVCTNSETRQAAHHKQLSTGKYIAIKDAQTVDPSITFEDFSHMTMREIKNISGDKNNGKCKQNECNIEHSDGHGYRQGHGGQNKSDNNI